ncbi:MAG: hypothetical protein ACM3RX_03785 [Methanococcaceae archaeon]
MKKLIVISAILITLFSCKKNLETVSVTPNIAVSLPKNYRIVENDPSGRAIYEALLDSDLIRVFVLPYNEAEPTDSISSKQVFRKNVDMFLEAYNRSRTDSTYSYNDSLRKCCLNFDFEKNNRKCTFSGEILAYKNKFVAVCFNTVKKDHSEKNRDMILSSINIKQE